MKPGMLKPGMMKRQAGLKNVLSPRSNLAVKRAAAVKLQSAYRRKRWRVLMRSVGQGAGGCFCNSTAYRPLVDAYGRVRGVRGPSGRWYVDRAFGCLSPLNPIRTVFILLIEASWFDNLILLTILANCVVLALSGRPETSALYINPELTEQLELVFIATFTGELVCKAIAMGIFTDPYHALLSEPWNQLDLVVVVTAWLPLAFPELSTYTSLRALRAFRPLRAAHMLPGVRRQVNTLIKALPFLANVAILILFIGSSFAIFGMQLFKGQLRYRCYAEEALRAGGLDPTAFAPGDDAPLGIVPIDAVRGVCNPGVLRKGLSQSALHQIATHTSEYADAAISGISGTDRHVEGGCLAGVCLDYGASPHAGTISFDDFGHSLMTVFMCITGEGWSEVMYLAMKGYHPAAAAYFILLTLFGSFYIVNLFLAVLWETYSSLPKELTPEEQIEQKRWRRDHTEELDGDLEAEPLVAAKAREMWQILPSAAQEGGDGKSFIQGGRWRFRSRLKRLVTSNAFRIQIMVLILANTGIMMLESHPQPAYQAELIEYANLVFFGCYAVEMVLKLVALGLAGYWEEPFNRFDGTIVLLSGADIVINYYHVDVGLDAQVLRAFRLLRIFKIARSWDNLYIVIRSLFFTLLQLRDLIVVLLLFLFVYALLGMQMFGGRLHASDARDLYDSIEHAMLTVFIAVTGEQWNDQWMRVKAALGLWTGVYYVVLVYVGDYIILNLVVAIVIREVGKADAYIRMLKSQQKSIAFEGNIHVRNRQIRKPGADVTGAPNDAFEESNEDATDVLDDEEAGCCLGPARCVHACAEARKHHSLLIFAPDSWLRRLAAWLLSARLPGTPIGLEFLVLSTVVVSSAVVALDAGCSGFAGGGIANLAFPAIGTTDGLLHGGDAASSRTELPQFIARYLIGAMLISLLEIVCKIVAFGMFTADVGFMRSGWNQLDAFIAVFCVAELIETGLPSGLILRSVHILRPLRLVARLPGLQRVVKVLYEVLPRVGNILLVYGLFQTVFAVLGVQTFAGKFGACLTDGSQPSKFACLAANQTWQQAPETGSFDNFLSASLLLFEISSLEGWPNAMYLGVDAVGVDLAMEEDHNSAMSLFFVLWVFLGGFVVLNVFVGVLIDTFAQMENTDRFGGVFTSHQQQHWVETLEASTSVRPMRQNKTPRGAGCRAWVYRRVTHPRFETLILCVILFNSMLMALDGADIPTWMHVGLDQANDACTAIFVVEALLKLIGHGISDYLSEGWNVFDLLVVIVALLEKALEVFAGATIKGALFRLARLARGARVLRTLRMIKSSRAIQSLLMTLLYSIPPLLNIMTIFGILMFVYAVLGMELFSGVMWGEYLNAEANFCSFGVAMLTMFRCATGEDWNGIMHDAMVTPDRGCHPELRNCGSWMAVPFFVSYIILSSFVILKMLIALIIENYKRSKREETRLVHTVHRDAFVEEWANVDPEGTGQLAVSSLHDLVRALQPPLGPDPREFHKGTIKERDISSFIMSLDLLAYEAHSGGGKAVLFHDVLLALTTRALDMQAQRDQAQRDQGGPDKASGGSPSSQRPGSSSSPPATPSGSVLAQAGILARAKSSSSKASSSTPSLASSPSRGKSSGGLTNLINAARLSNGVSSSSDSSLPADPQHGDSFSRSTSFEEAPQHTQRTSVVEERNLFNLRAMFAHKARQTLKFSSSVLQSALKRPSRRAGSSADEHTNEPTSSAAGTSEDAPSTGTALVFSLSAEYAATVLQRRWREARRRREARARLKVKRAQSAPATVDA